MFSKIGIFSEINTIIGTREDVDNVLADINNFLFDSVGQFFTIGVGPDGPTATWSREWAQGNFPLMVFMGEVAAILRRKLDIAAHITT